MQRAWGLLFFFFLSLFSFTVSWSGLLGSEKTCIMT